MNLLINYPDYDVDTLGNVYKNGKLIKPFNSNGYYQVLLFDKNHNRKVFGVHTLVATKYINSFYEGCVVHHINHNKHDNRIENLEVMSRKDHSSQHSEYNMNLANYVKNNGPWNKGKKMNDKYREKCKIAAIKRTNNNSFNGNQFVNSKKMKLIVPIIFNDPSIKGGKFN